MFWRQLEVVLWKNLLIRKRHWLLTAVESFLPIALFLLMVYARSRYNGLSKTHIDTPTHFNQKLLDNEGIYIGSTNFFITPNDVRTRNIFHRVCIKFQIPGENVHYFNTTEELTKYYYKNHNDTVIAILFNTNNPKVFEYTIRFHVESYYFTDSFLDTSTLYQNLHGFEKSDVPTYIQQGFMSLQAALDVAFMEEVSGKSLQESLSLYAQEFPYPPHTEDPIKIVIIEVLPLLTMFSFIFICPAVLKRVVEEKQAGTKELMKMIGMKSWMLWLGWFIYGLLPIILSVTIIVILLKVPVFGPNLPIEYCDPTVLFVFLLMYCMASICFCFAISSFFNKPTIAMIVGLLIWILSYIIPKNALSDTNRISWSTRILFCLFPNMALHYGYSVMATFEEREVGSQWYNIHKAASDNDNDITILNVWLMFAADMFLFTLLTFYMDGVNPGKYGVRKAYLYPVKALQNMFRQSSFVIADSETVDLQHVEDKNREICVDIKNLYKKYHNKMAVNNLNLRIYNNEITVLLGHNGAGKTTTMSIITGMLEATAGTVTINGVDIKENMDEIRQFMGLCPQHNLLFTDLTVGEHLIFFAKLKSVRSCDINKEVDELLQVLHLSDKKHSMANTLSGGMKRKLCLGMALIGGSKVLVLDEPSSGLDPESRRELWDLLLQYRKEKMILITTHFMEEADVLGDRIAIMSEGTLLCAGSPMELKNKYNTGYHLSLTVRENTDELDKAMLENVVKDIVKDTKVLSVDGNTIVYLLPSKINDTIGSLLAHLENEKDNLKIVNISFNNTTLEDVFLKTAAEEKGDENDGNINASRDLDWSGESNERHILRDSLTLMNKKMEFVRAKLFSYLIPVGVAFIFFGLTAYLCSNSGDHGSDGGPPLNLKLSTYDPGMVYYNVTGNSADINRLKGYLEKVVTAEKSQARFMKDVDQEVIDKGIENIVYYKKSLIAGTKVKLEKDNIQAIAMYSTFATHSPPISLNLITNVMAKYLLGEDYSISTRNWPLETIESNTSPQEYSKYKIYELWVFLIPFGCLFVVGSFIIFPYMEICSGFLRLQFMCGVNPITYWFTNCLSDFLLYLIVMLLPTLILCCTVALLRGMVEFGCLLWILLMYGFASMPLTYIFSRRKSLSGAFALFVVTMMFLGTILTFVIEGMAYSKIEELMEAGEAWRIVFLILIPQFGLTLVVERFALKAVDNYNMDLPGRKPILCLQDNPCCQRESAECAAERSYAPVLSDLWYMLICFIVYFFINISCDIDCTKKAYSKIRARYQRVRYNLVNDNSSSQEELCHDNSSTKSESNQVIMEAHGLNKAYAGKNIVRNINFTLARGECLGILGVNGAGKTTTFRMLTKEEFPDEGTVKIYEDKSSSSSNTEYLQKLGYCPQVDALNFVLTGRQILTTMAKLRNVDDNKVPALVENFLEIFELKDHADKPCGHYSGGNKRKLSLAVALIGGPDCGLLDEPTTGVDPSARRHCWSIIKSMQKRKGISFILTSHSMNECEALCNSLKIMKDGKFYKEGTISELKNQHGGFSVKLKLSEVKKVAYDDVDGSSRSVTSIQNNCGTLEDLKNHIECSMNGEIKDEHWGLLHFYLNAKNKKWSQIFKEVQALQSDFPFIEDYEIGEASLEDIFLSVARTEDDKEKEGNGKKTKFFCV